MTYNNKGYQKPADVAKPIGLEAKLPPMFETNIVNGPSGNSYCQWDAILGGCGKGSCKTSRVYIKK